MKSKRAEQWPAAIEKARSEFASWRAQKRGRERIPDALWRTASSAARRHGVHAVSRALSLNHADLKRRMNQKAGTEEVEGFSESAFVELVGAGVGAGPGCVVELEKGNGTRMRICVGDAAAIDWARMKEAFLGG